MYSQHSIAATSQSVHGCSLMLTSCLILITRQLTLVIFGEFIALTASYCGLKVVLHGQTATRESDSLKTQIGHLHQWPHYLKSNAAQAIEKAKWPRAIYQGVLRVSRRELREPGRMSFKWRGEVHSVNLIEPAQFASIRQRCPFGAIKRKDCISMSFSVMSSLLDRWGFGNFRKKRADPRRSSMRARCTPMQTTYYPLCKPASFPRFQCYQVMYF